MKIKRRGSRDCRQQGQPNFIVRSAGNQRASGKHGSPAEPMRWAESMTRQLLRTLSICACRRPKTGHTSIHFFLFAASTISRLPSAPATILSLDTPATATLSHVVPVQYQLSCRSSGVCSACSRICRTHRTQCLSWPSRKISGAKARRRYAVV